ncbi:ATP-binding SpoIIE family protein phosphatase [Vibrio panuliri]|uniref:Two-component system sensor histidine kinase/response regulator n=1 Tax=Vibrio panuliri TaxID=1381081 RepID=A0ABX3FCR2_9VIBR|nr:fused response regulator/phosphatase [Vibrio panuliri]KAB1458008.1 fused response regulator/phosphatase [Vibrio panuliri]OLQ89637.1 two-component system sensor histidine kinase/response regulator [Vibrio panuliri]
MRIVIVDDQETNRELCRLMLSHVTSRVDTFASGVGVVDAMRQMPDLPDIVLLDVMMPEQNGFTTAQQVRQAFPDKHIAIIFLTVLDDHDSFERCLSLGDDFVLKPVESSVLLAKVQAHYRIVTMHNEVMAQRDELSLFHEQTRYDYAIAESIFANLKEEMSTQVKHVYGVDYISTPSTVFNGDLIVVANRPHGGVYVMIADATGHGLPAAISAIPATRAFFSMAVKGMSLGEIVGEINHVLERFLPSGMMLAASFFEVRASGFEVSWWGGGLPDAYILDRDGKIIRRLESKHMPLGVLSNKQFEANLVHLTLEPNQRIIAYTDGVIEAVNQQGEWFGQERLEKVLQSGCMTIPSLYQSIKEFADKSVEDDLSILSMQFPISSDKSTTKLDIKDSYSSLPIQSTLSFPAEVIKQVNLMSDIRRFLAGIIFSGPHLDLVCSVLSELVTNAIDHGLLCMDSTIKEQPEGFFLFYQKREQELKQMREDAWLQVNFDYQPDACCLVMVLEHNGVGFDYRAHPKQPSNGMSYGRGIVLATELCDSLEYSNEGKKVTATYCFEAPHRFPVSK